MGNHLLGKTNQRRLIVLALLCMVGVLTNSIFQFRRAMQPRADARREVRHFMSQIEIGDTQTQVKEKFREGHYLTLELQELQSNLWSIRTPYEFGAGNWIVRVEFEDAKVTALHLSSRAKVMRYNQRYEIREIR